MQSLQVVIFEPNEVTRHGLQMMLGSVDRKLQICGTFGDVQSCEAYLKEHNSHALLLDESLPRSIDLWSLIERWRALRPGSALIVLSDTLSVRHVERLFQSGVLGYIYREDCVKSTLSACLEAVLHKHAYVSPRASAALYQRQAHAHTHGLSRVDIDVIHALDQGMNTQETAQRLGLDVRTIYRSKNNLRQVLGVKTNEQILDAARRRGLLDSVS